VIDRTWPVLPTVLKSQQIESARFFYSSLTHRHQVLFGWHRAILV